MMVLMAMMERVQADNNLISFFNLHKNFEVDNFSRSSKAVCYTKISIQRENHLHRLQTLLDWIDL